ncbi:hypothetical protein LOD99_3114 [Oopsacas minuta]|uniref:Uncharacterized protein n=1 Tax=Oopsacas minuta TaxID=111878 RepID=A0AAV7JYA4_9METZ|nr:hypothetical protein LOD99_3114 [Oopsacas minuta]
MNFVYFYSNILEIDPELIRLVEAIEKQQGLKEELYDSLDFVDISRHALDILSALVAVNTNSAPLFPSRTMLSPLAPLLQQLHTSTKTFEYCEPPIVSSLRSPEGKVL